MSYKKENVKSVFNEEFKHIKLDKKFIKALEHYVIGFINKDNYHVEFFGNALLAENPPKYTAPDRERWFLDLLDVNEAALKQSVHSLDSINTSFMVSSDVNNLSYFYLAHRFLTDKGLSDKERNIGASRCLEMLHYKFITSLLYNLLPYGVDRTVAVATYASLNRKYDLRVAGSWLELVRRKVQSILDEKALHAKTLREFEDDEAIVYMVNDVQTRIRKQINAIVDVFMAVREADARIRSQSSLGIDLDGDSFLRDKSNRFSGYIHYMHDIISDRDSFIKPELIQVVNSVVSSSNDRVLNEALEFFSDNIGESRSKYLTDLLDETLLFSFNFVNEQNIDLNDLPLLMLKLRGVVTISTDPTVTKIKKLLTKLVKDSVRSRNDTLKAGIRTAVFLYLVIRALAKKHYS